MGLLADDGLAVGRPAPVEEEDAGRISLGRSKRVAVLDALVAGGGLGGRRPRHGVVRLSAGVR